MSVSFCPIAAPFCFQLSWESHPPVKGAVVIHGRSLLTLGGHFMDKNARLIPKLRIRIYVYEILQNCWTSKNLRGSLVPFQVSKALVWLEVDSITTFVLHTSILRNIVVPNKHQEGIEAKILKHVETVFVGHGTTMGMVGKKACWLDYIPSIVSETNDKCTLGWSKS